MAAQEERKEGEEKKGRGFLTGKKRERKGEKKKGLHAGTRAIADR